MLSLKQVVFPPDAPSRTLVPLAEMVLETVHGMFQSAPPTGEKPVQLFVHPKMACVDGWRLNGDYRIWVTQEAVAAGNYGRFALELAHELAHIYLDLASPNSGLEETLCVAAAHHALEVLARRVEECGSPIHVMNGESFRACKAQQIRDTLPWFPPVVRRMIRRRDVARLTLYLRFRRNDQDENPFGIGGDYRLNTLGATALLLGPVPWEEMTGMTRVGAFQSMRSRNLNDVDNDWRIDVSRLPSRVRDSLKRLGRVSDRHFSVWSFDLPFLVPGGLLFWENRRWLWLREHTEQSTDFLDRFAATLDAQLIRREGPQA